MSGKTEKEKMLAGLPYRADDPELADQRRRCQAVLEEFNRLPKRELELTELGRLLASVGEQTYVERPFVCDYGFNISIGRRTFINYAAIVLDVARVTIGDEVQIATGVQLLTAEHPMDPVARRAGNESARPIAIHDGVWIAGGTIVCPGVTIGENSVIGAGSVVTRDVEPGVLAAGNPCREVRRLP